MHAIFAWTIPAMWEYFCLLLPVAPHLFFFRKFPEMGFCIQQQWNWIGTREDGELVQLNNDDDDSNNSNNYGRKLKEIVLRSGEKPEVGRLKMIAVRAIKLNIVEWEKMIEWKQENKREKGYWASAHINKNYATQ